MQLNRPILLDLNLCTRDILGNDINYNSLLYDVLCLDIHNILDINLFNVLTSEIRL